MVRKKNSEVGSAGSIVVAHSIKRELAPNLGVVAERLGLSSKSEILTMIASDIEASVAAMRPLADAQNTRREAEETRKVQRKDNLKQLKGMSADDLAKLVAQAEPTQE